MNRNLLVWGLLLGFLWLATSQLTAQNAPPGSNATPGVAAAIPPSGQKVETNSQAKADVWTPPPTDTPFNPLPPKETNSAAFEETKAKAEKGDAEAQWILAGCYAGGQGVAQDQAVAVKWHRKAAEQNYADAQVNLGFCYADGLGVTQDYVQAYKWFSLAAAQRNIVAGDGRDRIARSMAPDQIAEGKRLAAEFVPRRETPGSTTAPEATKAKAETGHSSNTNSPFEIVKTGAVKGDALYEYQLGEFYLLGEYGAPKDEVEAVKWFRKAAEQHDPIAILAQYFLGTCYDQGHGVAQDHAEAVKLYREAADQGFAEAQNQLGFCYFSTGEGLGVARGSIEAVKWFRAAANQGYAEAQCNLGRCYFMGRGVSQDYVQAYKWFNLAAAQGNTNASIFLPAIALRLSPEAITEAERLSSEFAPRKQGEREKSDFTSNGADTAPKATGTGFFITDDGYLISNYHVVKDAAKVRLLTSAGLIEAKVVQVDAANDLALLKAVGRFAPLPIAASRTVALGGTVATVGFPDIGLQGFAPKLAKGEIASLSGAGDDPRYFQISVPVQPGNSGGALVDERGNVIGIVSAKLDAGAALAASGALPENVNYAVKSSLLLSFLESVPAVSAKLKTPLTADRKFEDVVKSAQGAAVLVLVY
jgi:TPR repeat protein